MREGALRLGVASGEGAPVGELPSGRALRFGSCLRGGRFGSGVAFAEGALQSEITIFI